MNILAALVRKELRQHWWAILLLGALSLVGLLALAGSTRTQGDSPLEALRHFIVWIAFLAAALLCNRLVATEYQARTQLFLEALPLERWQMVLTKYALGLSVLSSVVGTGFVLACAMSTSEAFTDRFVYILAARSFSVMWVIYSFCFLTGLLGRYRVALTLVTLLSVLMLNAQTDFEPERFGPAKLVDHTFPYEREEVPWGALAETWALGLGLMGLAVGLSLTREGSVATLLAQRMSYREKVFIATLMVAYTGALMELADKSHKAPFKLEDAVVEKRPGVRVSVALQAGGDARALAAYLADELEGAREYLAMDHFQPVFVAYRADLDPDQSELGTLQESEGVFARANYAPSRARSPFSRQRFLVWLLREALRATGDGRFDREHRHWALDGFPLFWVNRIHPDARLPLRAAYADFSGTDLDRWLSFTDRVGDDVASAVAWSLLDTLEKKAGPERAQAVLRDVFDLSKPTDVRELLEPRGLDAPLRRLAALPQADLLAACQADLDAVRRTRAGELAAVPRPSARLDFAPLSKDSRTASFRLQLSGPPVRYAMLYSTLGPFDRELPRKSFERYDDSSERPQGELPGSFSAGERLLWTVEVPSSALGCSVISGWVRQDVP